VSDPILVAKSSDEKSSPEKSWRELFLLPQMSNRHGMITGATGTGKTVSLQVMAEGFSRIGVPVFLADVKGDLAGISQPGGDNPKVAERARTMGIDLAPEGSPVVFWDIFGEQGHPVRATVSEMGPLLLSRMLNLNDTQEGVLATVFKIADDGGLLLLDLKDLRAILQYAGDNAGQFQTEYGHISAASVGTIQRGLLELEQQGGDHLFGEPALNLDDLLQTDNRGRGIVNVLAADRLMQSPRTYSTFLLWLLSELFERLPEVGDPEKPKLVFFFDEAHLLFDDAPKALQDKVEQVVRLIRSKGIGVFFCSQNPLDVPDDVLGQLGNRVQHALRAFTPRDQKAVRAAADTFRQNPGLNLTNVITQLGVGEALVSFLDPKGMPEPVERALIRPPNSRIGPVIPQERQRILQQSVLQGVYERQVDRESAYEMLKKRAETAAEAQQKSASVAAPARRPGRQPDSLLEAMTKSAVRAAGSQLGRQILRGLLGSILGGSQKR
jgi:DNA double-strand break repair helicase HerA and related ATPase